MEELKLWLTHDKQLLQFATPVVINKNNHTHHWQSKELLNFHFLVKFNTKINKV